MTRPIQVGIIGCGGIAFGKHLPSLTKLEHVNIVAFCDIDKEKAERAAKEYGAEDAVTYEDYIQLIEKSPVEVVHVCTPNNSHAEISIAALRGGKHVMCEKPMAKTVEEAQAMVDAAKKYNKKLTIGYNNRFRPDSQYLKKICQRGDLGDIYFAKAHAIRRRAVPTWGVFLDEEKQGGGPLIDIGTHALDLTLWMMDNYEPKSVMGTTHHQLGKKKDAANPWGPWNPNEFTVEDAAFGFITMKNGATIILESSWALNSLDVDEAKCSLSGTEGGADMKEGLRLHGEDLGELYTKKVNLGPGGVAFYDGDTESDAELEARMWIESIINEEEATVLPKEALVVTQILEAIYQSAKTGKAVYFD
ncbi:MULTISPECIES: Gfo/Idh/MocA family oxidoreductase [Oceanobacillus]|uniref:Gfo/Idh/MocA family oxidoreductase n=1 Tax=Oceanobacillus kimchii TaxID=746691 RepID=A0ABQ5TN17_9BACI|nr:MULTISPECIES: Gfo/Idh/MocA family oxidoreductase [Oceanobacillus]MBT2599922.1 Gfo/Idh/MocA family oxidoreductase [Oceanobacillus sp. ISL-74]MBT2652628.1 Gfo/Idh/MocA family oxidoreductase [Oceanobacillus sp. ISL-73]MCT1577170.1 Gfo/Idh/MocA family oxidoreductase [Oceanobacillus kimchii]MCT2135240.1 Gfo/Idh/MocA family oxidoreductase [Oceanobacillus kimchii]GLO68208.1 Gfo/Idh/MocA family oxidoreductase [Oceanobacillus kimchii]